jgi:ABC-type nickel/cobalt efflux system permease component RcnA
MRKLKKSTGLTLALLIYVSATAAYFLPRNTEISSTEKYITVAASYLIVLALWFVLRKKEEYRRRQLEENRRYQVQKQEKKG